MQLTPGPLEVVYGQQRTLEWLWDRPGTSLDVAGSSSHSTLSLELH